MGILLLVVVLVVVVALVLLMVLVVAVLMVLLLVLVVLVRGVVRVGERSGWHTTGNEERIVRVPKAYMSSKEPGCREG